MKTRDKFYGEGFEEALVSQRAYFKSNDDGNRKNRKNPARTYFGGRRAYLSLPQPTSVYLSRV